MLIPDFITNNYPILNSKYITLLEIGGSHAHRLKPLIESLGLISLIITDIDAIEEYEESNKNGNMVQKYRKVQSIKHKSYLSGNDTLEKWIPQKKCLDELLALDDNKKISSDSRVRVAYQYPFNVTFKDEIQEVIPYTFEDALAFSNIEIFNGLSGVKGLLKKMKDALAESTINKAGEEMFEALKKGKKAEMALELLYIEEPLEPPQYIKDGLDWLQLQLTVKSSSNEEAIDSLDEIALCG